MTEVSAIALRARLRVRGVGTSPGASGPSRTAAPMIVTRPANRNNPINERPSPIGLLNVRREYATTTTGTTTLPAPLAPFTLTVMLLDPPLIIQSFPAYTDGSSAERSAISGGGDAP